MGYRLGDTHFICDNCNSILYANINLLLNEDSAIELLHRNKWEIINMTRTPKIPVTYKNTVTYISGSAHSVEYSLKCSICLRKQKLKKVKILLEEKKKLKEICQKIK